MICGRPLDGMIENIWSSGHFNEFTFDKKADILSKCDGQFCGIDLSIAEREIIIFADKLAIRPIYYLQTSELLIFSTVFRILKESALLRRTVDLRGTAEQAALGQPLKDRTVFNEVRSLEPGALLRVAGGRARVQRYWRWDTLPAGIATPSEAPKACFDAFTRAVSRRLGGARDAQAFLSGGLDSRLVVSALRQAGVELTTWNFSPAGSADQLLGAQYAQVVGSTHRSGFWVPQRFATSSVYPFANLVAKALDEDAPRPQSPRVFWAGDGGSFGLGHIYMNDEMVAAQATGGPAALLERFPHLTGFLPRRCFRRGVLDHIDTKDSIIEEMVHYDVISKDRHLYLFTLLNDQRRHLYAHYEEIDVHRIEYELPFFDGDFLQAVFSAPISFGLRHRLYHEVIRHFPDWFSSVAWQAYPGHLPSPTTMPDTLKYQWGNLKNDLADIRRKHWKKRSRQIVLQRMPDIIRRDMVLLYTIGAQLGSNYTYVFEPLNHFLEAYAAESGGVAMEQVG